MSGDLAGFVFRVPTPRARARLQANLVTKLRIALLDQGIDCSRLALTLHASSRIPVLLLQVAGLPEDAAWLGDAVAAAVGGRVWSVLHDGRTGYEQAEQHGPVPGELESIAAAAADLGVERDDVVLALPFAAACRLPLAVEAGAPGGTLAAWLDGIHEPPAAVTL